jgi:hypothetical protein
MMRSIRALIRDASASSAAEIALIAPMLIILMFGSVELGNYFLTEHAVTKQVRDGARSASRLTLADDYSCAPGSDLSSIYKDADADEKIINVTETGSVDGSASGRFNDGFWAACTAGEPVTVSVRCVDKDSYGGIYQTLDGDIPVVAVSASVAYPSLFGAIGFPAADLCLNAQSEAVVAGL